MKKFLDDKEFWKICMQPIKFHYIPTIKYFSEDDGVEI